MLKYLQRLEQLPELQKYFLLANRINSFESFTIEKKVLSIPIYRFSSSTASCCTASAIYINWSYLLLYFWSYLINSMIPPWLPWSQVCSLPVEQKPEPAILRRLPHPSKAQNISLHTFENMILKSEIYSQVTRSDFSIRYTDKGGTLDEEEGEVRSHEIPWDLMRTCFLTQSHDILILEKIPWDPDLKSQIPQFRQASVSVSLLLQSLTFTWPHST